MIWFKACPRCKIGDLVLSQDQYGKYHQCFQCGHVIYPREELTTVSRQAGKAAKKERIAA